MRFASLFLAWVGLVAMASAQQSLSSMPRYDRYTQMNANLHDAIISGGVKVIWAADSKSFGYFFKSQWYRYDVAKHASAPADGPPTGPAPENRPHQVNGGNLERGRQYSSATSPDGKLKAVSRDRNVYLSAQDNKQETALTTDGSVTARIKYGTASWVYGEELDATVAMWWSPGSEKLAFYRFDESEVPDYYVTLDEGRIQNRLDAEAYPKAGASNPKVSVLVYDVATRKTVPIDADMGDHSKAEYVFDVKWSDDGKWLLYNRTDRKQQRLQLCAADPVTGASHMVVEEIQPQSWAENHPEIKFLSDGQRFIWTSERNGFKNYYLYDLGGHLLKTLTKNNFDAGQSQPFSIDGWSGIVRCDEKAGWLYYTSSGVTNPYYVQLHRVRLDGSHDQTLTDPNALNEVTLSPDGNYFTDIVQTPGTPPETRLVKSDGKVLDTFVKSDISRFNQLGLRPTEMFTYLAADGKTNLYGIIQYPSDFDPQKKYPVLLSVYGGPESPGISPHFRAPLAITEFGFITVNLAGRGTLSRGKAFKDQVYGKLGVVEMDDQNAGIRALGSRPYIDLNRVGVFGTSYGGYSTAMLLLRHPETFAVGCSSSPVTDWRNYDTIYTERYMGLPSEGENKAGYEAGSAMTYAANLKGKLMLYFGSADNNVHPSNTYQLTRKLESSGKFYDLQVGTDQGHSQMNTNRMWAYFIQHLILDPTPK